MALNNVGLGIVFRAQDFASNVVRGLGNTLSSLTGRSFQARDELGRFKSLLETFRPVVIGVAKGLAAAAVGFIGLRSAFKLAAPAGEFQQNLAAVGAVSQATTDQLRGLEEAAIQAGVATQFSPTEAVQGLRSLATAGQTTEQSIQTLIPVLDLAAGSLGQLGVAGAADAVVGTLNSFQFEASRATEVTDKLLRITQLTNFQTQDFQIGLSKAAAAGAQFGQSLEDTLIVVGLMRNANIDASSASTAFREATRRLASEQRAQKSLTEAGVEVFNRQTGAMRAIPDVMLDLVKATKNMTDEQRNQIVVQAFGARGMLAFNAVMRAQRTVMTENGEVTLRGAEAINSLRREMASAEGTAQSFKDALLDTFEGQKTLLRGTMETIAIAIGKPFERVLKPIVSGVVNTLNFMLGILLRIPDPIKDLFAGLLVAGSITALFGGLAFAIKALLPLLIALKGVALTALAPFLPIVLAITAIIAALFLLKQAWDTNFGGLRDVGLEVIETIRQTWAGFIEDIRLSFNDTFNDLGITAEEFKFVIVGLMQTLADVIQVTLDTVKPALQLVIGSFGGFMTAILGVVTGNTELMIRGVTRAINTAVRFLNALVDQATKVAFALGLSDERLIALSESKFDELRPEDVAVGLGAGLATVQNLANDTANAPTVGAPSVAAAGGSLSVPSSGGTGPRALTADDIAIGVERAIQRTRQSEDRAPIVIQGKVNMFPREVGELIEADTSDQSARRGRFRSIFGGA